MTTKTNDSPCSLSTYEQVWDGIYDMDKGPASLNYLSLGAGFIVGLQISHPVMDKVGSFVTMFRTSRC
jgi:hypothetical protein